MSRSGFILEVVPWLVELFVVRKGKAEKKKKRGEEGKRRGKEERKRQVRQGKGWFLLVTYT
jgi:hypothetical protein